MTSPDTDTPFDASRCPVCGTLNQCAMEIQRVTGIAQPPCWCTRVPFPPLVLERVPASAQGKACICQACASS